MVFKKGKSGNPRGRPPMPQELKEVVSMSPQKLKALIFKFMHMNRGELKRVAEDPNSTLVDCTIASIVNKAMAEGDYTRLNFLLDRSIGKVKDELSINSNITFRTSFTPDGSLLQEVLNEDSSEYEPLQIK